MVSHREALHLLGSNPHLPLKGRALGPLPPSPVPLILPPLQRRSLDPPPSWGPPLVCAPHPTS